MRIMVVDDEAAVIETIVDFLEDCGHQTTQAGDGAEALRILEAENDFGLVISDIRMPRMDGLEFLERVRVEFPGIPVILITGHGDESLAVAALQQGAFDYIKKPIKLRAFQTCVAKAEERHALEDLIVDKMTAPVPARTEAQVSRQDFDALVEDIAALRQMWTTVGDYLASHPSSDQAEERRLNFLTDEIPGVIGDLEKRLARMASVSETVPECEPTSQLEEA